MRNRVPRLVLALIAFTAAQGVLPIGASRLTTAFVARVARAESNAELTAARKLFAEALADESAQRYGVALEKFQRVQAVRDTQAVRYRIATCFEAMGKLRAALEGYTAASIAAGTDAESANVARVARDKLASLSKRVGRVVVNLPPKAPEDAVVKIDGEVVQSNAIGTPVVVDPGAHEITAVAAGMQPFRAPATIAEGATQSVEIAFEPVQRAAPPPDVPAPVPVVAPPPPPPVAPPPPAAAPEAPSHTGRMVGVVAVTAGGVLVAGSVALLLARQAEISSLENACPGGLCPVSRESELEATRSRALVEGPVAIGLGAAGAIMAGVGIVLLATAGDGHPAKTALAPWVDRDTRGFALSTRF